MSRKPCLLLLLLLLLLLFVVVVGVGGEGGEGRGVSLGGTGFIVGCRGGYSGRKGALRRRRRRRRRRTFTRVSYECVTMTETVVF